MKYRVSVEGSWFKRCVKKASTPLSVTLLKLKDVF